MQILKMISSLVFLIRPLCALSRLLVSHVAAIIRGVRPTMALTRVCYVLLGIVLLLGACGAERGGQRNYAIALAAAGAILLILRRHVIVDTRTQDDDRGTSRRGAAALSWPLDGGWMRARPSREPEQPIRDEPERRAFQMPSDLLRLGWSRKRLAVNSSGDLVLPKDPAAVAWSLCGALNAVFEPNSHEWKSYLAALQAMVTCDLVGWNRNPGRTQQQVVDAALKAEKRLRTYTNVMRAAADRDA